MTQKSIGIAKDSFQKLNKYYETRTFNEKQCKDCGTAMKYNRAMNAGL